MHTGSNSRGNPCADLQRKPPLDQGANIGDIHDQRSAASTARDQIGTLRGIKSECLRAIVGIRRIAPLDAELVDKVVALTLELPSHESTHWTVRAMAKAIGVAASSVVKIWHDHGLAPHRWHSFKLSNDKGFAEKLHDVIGLYVSPPAHAIVLSVDEKSQILALDRTQTGLPLKRGRGPTMTYDSKRDGTTPCLPHSMSWMAR